MSDAWLIAVAIVTGSWIIGVVAEKGLKRIADRIDNHSRIADEVRKELNSIKARVGNRD